MECSPSEKRATVVVICGILLFVYHEFHFDSKIGSPLVIVLLCCTAVLLLSFTDSVVNKVYRKNAAVGYLCCPLLSVCLFVSRSIDDVASKTSVTFALGSMIVAVAASGWTAKAATRIVLWRMAMLAVGVASVIWVSTVFALNQEFIFTAALLVLQLYLFQLLPKKLPQSFTVGELIIVTQGMCLFILRTVMLYQSAATQILNHIPLSADVECVLFIQTAVVSSSLVVLVLFVCEWFRSPIHYYALVFGVAGLFSLPLLAFYFQRDFISWLINFIYQDREKIALFAYWSMCSVALWLILYLNATALNQVESKRSADNGSSTTRESAICFPDQKKGVISKGYGETTKTELHPSTSKHRKLDVANRTSVEGRPSDVLPSGGATVPDWCRRKSSNLTITRKQFHVAAVVIFVPGLFYDVRLIYVASSCALVVLIMVETLRVLRVPPFGAAINQYFQVFVDDRDGGLVLTTHLYLLIGCSSPLWLHNGANTSLVLYSGLLSLGIGDTCASVIGSRYGRHKWRNSSKSVEGSIASFLSQLLFALLIEISGHVSALSLPSVALCLLLNSLLEAFTSQIDNLVLPLFTYLLVATAT